MRKIVRVIVDAIICTPVILATWPGLALFALADWLYEEGEVQYKILRGTGTFATVVWIAASVFIICIAFLGG